MPDRNIGRGGVMPGGGAVVELDRRDDRQIGRGGRRGRGRGRAG